MTDEDKHGVVIQNAGKSIHWIVWAIDALNCPQGKQIKWELIIRNNYN